MPTADSPNSYMCETTDYTAYVILIRRINNCAHKVETYCIYLFRAVNFPRQKRVKHGHSLLVRRATSEYPAFTLITSRTVERGDVYFSLYQKERGTDTVLSQVQFLGLRIKSFNISDLRKTLSS